MFVKYLGAMCYHFQINKVFTLNQQPFNQHLYNLYKFKSISGPIRNTFVNSDL